MDKKMIILVLLMLQRCLPQTNAQFLFPDQQMQQQQQQQTVMGIDNSTLTRHYFPPFPLFPPFPTQFPIPIVTAAPVVTTTTQTCICVPIGSCTGTGTPTNPVDGSGIIDIRIVNNSPVTTTTTAPTTICLAGLQQCCFAGPYQCGVRYPPVANSPLPAAGQSAYGRYPWQAVLLGPGDVYQGSGVLVDPLNVLTVAHKVANYTASPGLLRVRLGEWNAAGDTEPLPAQEFYVSRIFLHPNFNAANLMNDVAILRLSTRVPLGQLPTITTACLPVQSFVGQRCWVSGWGKNDFITGIYQTIQKEVDVPILPSTTCQSSLASTRLGSTYVFDANSFICAGGEIGKDACTGDGGSPLVCQLNGRWFVAGLVAWGIGCATTNIPGVYVNVATYLSFIQTSIATV